MINRKAKKFFDYYLKIVKTEEYQSFLKQTNQEELKNYREHIEKEHPEWRDRTDYFDEFSIGKFIIIDILSNDGVNKLVSRLHSLPKSKFKVTNYFRKPSLFNKLDYIHLEYSRYGVGIFANIEIIGDKFLKSIDISWSKINNYYAAFEYTFHFSQPLTDSNLQLFITDNIKKFSKKDYIEWYYINNKEDKSNYLAIEQITGDFLSLICQHYITTFLYSEQGKTNKLINLTFAFRKKKVEINKIYFDDMGYSLYNKEGNYYISNHFNDNDFVLYSGNNWIPKFSILWSLSQYGNEFYYTFFGERELHIFERDFSKYVSGRKGIRFNKEFLSLLRKIQSLSKSENRADFSSFKEKLEKNWGLFLMNDEVSLEEISNKDLLYYQDVINENYTYLRMLTEINYTKTNTTSSIVATIISIIATIISVFALLG